MTHEHVGPSPRVAVSINEAEKRDLLRRAAERTVAESRPVSLAEVARDALRRGMVASGPGRAA